MGAPGGIQEITYTVPADKCGLVIGKGKGQLLGCMFPLRCLTGQHMGHIPPVHEWRLVAVLA